MSAAVYFWARLVHPIAYAMKIPVARTLAFVVGWGRADLQIGRAHV